MKTKNCGSIHPPKRRPSVLASSLAALVVLGLAPSSLRADEIVDGAGPGGGPQVNVLDANTLGLQNTFLGLPSTFTGGVTVAAGDGVIVVGSGKGGGQVDVYSASTDQLVDTLQPFGANFTGGVTVAVGDGKLVVGVGSGGSPEVSVYSDSTFAFQSSFFAFSPSFTGGVRVAVGDGSLVVGAGVGGGPDVQIYSDSTLALQTSFFAFNPHFFGGVTVAVGAGELVVGSGAGGGSQVNVYNDSTFGLQNSFTAFAPTFTGGVNVAVGGGEILTGEASGGLPQVNVYNASSLALQSSFNAFATTFKGGVSVAVLPVSPTWLASPGSGDWNTAANWNPSTVPNAINANAVFGASNTLAVSLSANTQVDSITFTSNATSPYTVTVNHGVALTISGQGIANNSGAAQNFVTAVDGNGNFGTLTFTNSATAGNATITNSGAGGGSGTSGGTTNFSGNATAGSATITNSGAGNSAVAGGTTNFSGNTTAGSATITNGGAGNNGLTGGTTNFSGSATAGSATITNSGASNSAVAGGATNFSGNATAGSATITNNGSGNNGSVGSTTSFSDYTTAGSATITVDGGTDINGGGASLSFTVGSTAGSANITTNGGTANGASGGVTTFGDPSYGDTTTAGKATLTTNGGTNGGGGGATYFTNFATGGTARAITNTGGTFDISGLTSSGMTIGSISGGGVYALGSATLTMVGDGSAGVTVSGTIQDGGQSGGTGGSLVVSGATALTLTGQNTYTGTTGLINGGVLNANVAGALPAPAADGGNGTARTRLVMDQTGTGGSTLDLGANQAVSSLTGAATSTINTNGNVLTVGNSGIGTATFAGVIADGTGSAGAGGLTFDGSATQVLSGVNTYTGATTVNGTSTLIIGNGTTGNLTGTSGVTVATGAVFETNLANGATFAASIVLNGAGFNALQAGTNALSGVISGTGTFTQTGSGTTILTGANTYSGGTSVNAGTLQIGTAATAGSIAGTSGVLLDPGATLTLVNVATGTFDRDVDLATGGGTATLNIDSANTITLSGTLQNSNGTLALTKNGVGTAIISGNSNTYTGATTVNAGILEVDGTLGSTTVTVNKSAVLTGVGTIGGSVNILSGGTLEPMDGFSTIGGNLVLNTGANTNIRLADPGTDDTETVTGNLTLGGNLNLTPLLGFGPGVYPLFAYGGTLASTHFSAINGLPGYGATLTTGGGIVDLVVTLAGALPPMFWDGATTAGTGTITGGSGTWNSTTINWTDPTGTINSTWKSGTAFFGTTGGTVTLGSAISAQGLIFGVDGYTINGSSTLKLTLTGMAPMISVGSTTGTTATINAPISSANGLIANGLGTLVLTSTANAISGKVSIITGTVQLGTAIADGSLGASSAVTLSNGGTLLVMNVLNGVLPDSISAGLGQTGLLNIASANNTTLSGALTDGAPGQLALALTGTGTTILTNSKNTFSGPTSVGSGTLQIGTTAAAGSLGAGSPVSFNAGSNFDLDNVSGGIFANSVTITTNSFVTVNVNQTGTVTLSGALTNGAGKLQFRQNGGTTILSGNDQIFSTALSAGTVQVGDGTTTSINLDTEGVGISVNASTTLATDLASGAIFANKVSLNATTASLNAIQTGTNTLTGVISGIGKVNQKGSGTTILAAAETYTGPTTVSAGTLQIGNGASGNLGNTSAVTVSGGSLAVDLASGSTFTPGVSLSSATAALAAVGYGTNTLSGVISGSGLFVQAGPGATILTNAETYTGATLVNAGTLVVNGSLAAASKVSVASTGTLAGTGTIKGNATLAGTGVIALDSGGDIAGTLAVTGGDWTGQGTVGGAVTVSSGTLVLAIGASLTAPAGLTVAGGIIKGNGTLQGSLTYKSTSVQNDFYGVIADGSAPSSLTMSAAGSTFVLGGQNTYTGATTVTAGTLEIGADGLGSLAAASLVTVSGSGTLALALTDGSDFANDVLLNAATATLQALQVGTTTFTSSIGGTGGFTQAGPGTSILENAETYTGVTNVTGGVLEVDGSLGVGTTVKVAAGGTLTGAGTIYGNATLTGGGQIQLASTGKIVGTLGVTGGNWNGVGTVGGVVTSSSGNFNLGTNANLTATAGLDVTGGTFSATDATGTLTGSLTYTSTSNSTFGGVIADGTAKSALTLNKAGTTLTLSGTNTYTGATTVTAGTLLVNGSLAGTAVTVGTSGILGGSGTMASVETVKSGGTFAPGDGSTPGTFTVGDLQFQSGAKVTYQLGAVGATSAGNNDLTVVDGDLALTGTLNIIAGAGFGAGTYDLFNVTGTISPITATIGTVPTGFTKSDFTLQTVGTQVDLVVTGGPMVQYWNVGGGAGINGGTGNWDNATFNWTNATGTTASAWGVQSSVAVFSTGSGTVTVASNIGVTSLGFVPGAGAYTISVSPTFTLTISGAGLTNTSGTTQNFVTTVDGNGNFGLIYFTNSATAGSATTFTNQGSSVTSGNYIGAGEYFKNTSNAGRATFINQGSTIVGGYGGFSEFDNSASAGSATINNYGGANTGASNVPGGGGAAYFNDTADGGTAQVTNYGNGFVDMSGLTDAGMKIGSIAGSGAVFLGSKTLTVGGNNLSTTFSGVIQDGGDLGGTGGSIVKTGTGTLTLTGANTYTGATTVNMGTLQIGDGNTAAAALASPSVVTVGSGATLAMDLTNTQSFGNKVTDNGHFVALGPNSSTSYTVSSKISGSGDLTLNAANTTVFLTGTNTYANGTTVNAGTLVANNTTASATGPGPVVINSGGKFGGNNAKTGALTLNSGGNLFPGAGFVGTPGTTLHAASLLWNPSSQLTLQLGGTVHDALALSGALTKGTNGVGTWDIVIDDDGGITAGDFTLATFASTTFKLTDFNLDLPHNYTGHLIENTGSLVLDITSGSGQQPASDSGTSTDTPTLPTPAIGFTFDSNTISDLSVTPTPEPTSAALLAFGGTTLLAWRRRRKA